MVSPAPSLTGVGIGLRHPHFQDILDTQPEIPWLEVHPENYFFPGSSACHWLEAIRAHYPLSAHCVGLSLGSATPVDMEHLASLQGFIERYAPSLVSDHLSWSAVDGTFLPDLLPLPYTEEALTVLCRNISQVQESLNRQILIENPSSYAQFAASSIPEWEFLKEVVKRSGCGLLLDVNNVYVSCQNHGWNSDVYLEALPHEAVQELHLAGFSISIEGNDRLLIDTHSAPVTPEVWELYAQVIRKLPNVPTLIEWDKDIPPLATLLAEKQKAEAIAREESVHQAT
ncbi:MAG: DUF692 domain-containing protein [Hyphomicrobiales bacterium]|nr:DUF692 domain-containing protein [Hyphomicrobiales bacterium]